MRNPALTSVIVISVALGIGANTTIFTLINAVFLRPLPVSDPARLAQVFTVMPKSTAFQPVSLANYRDFRDNVREFSGLAAYQGIGANLVGGTEPIATGGQLVTGNYFQVLGVNAELGRTFLPEEDATLGASPVMVMSADLWKRAFGSDPGVVGRSVTLNGFKFTVIGVMPAAFKGLQTLGTVDFWVPVSMYEQLVTGETARTFYTARHAMVFQVVGRLQPDGTLERAREAMKAMARRLEEQYPTENEARSVELFPLTQSTLGVGGGRDNLVRSGGLLLAATGLVLLIACATWRACCSREPWSDARKSRCGSRSARPDGGSSGSCWRRAVFWPCWADRPGSCSRVSVGICCGRSVPPACATIFSI
jgi:putative ABC transport system permease protein